MEEKREENRLLAEVLVLVPTHEEDKIPHYLESMLHWLITCLNRYRGRTEDLVERSKKMESIASDNRKETEVGKEASRKFAKLNEKKEETPTKLTNQEESKIQKRAKLN
ncbi:hypothetical protein RRG08_022055 [Elysia crispata]|uniref:Uncharacterized protein n=1 Tax=Elysia crispata TaxID=231223 RepID=A0AAE0YYN0_9GAST|nr:hypothetical protein RRG08_022055 [Elysia crispata]